MKQYNGEKYIVSFTTFGKRMRLCGKMIYGLIRQTYKNFHIVVTLYKEDYKNIPPELQLFIDNDLIEVIEADRDLGPHLKYYYAMLKYGDKPIITVDDDRLYANDTIEKLVSKYEKLNYKSVISNCAIEMQKYEGRLIPYPKWVSHRLKSGSRSNIAMAEGFAGILYPPNCFKNIDTEEFIKGTLSCKYDDDLYLKVLEIRSKIPVTQSDYAPKLTEDNNIKEQMKYNLHNNQNKDNVNRVNLCYKFEKDLLKAWSM